MLSKRWRFLTQVHAFYFVDIFIITASKSGGGLRNGFRGTCAHRIHLFFVIDIKTRGDLIVQDKLKMFNLLAAV